RVAERLESCGGHRATQVPADVHRTSMPSRAAGAEDAHGCGHRAGRNRPLYDPAMTDVTTPAGYAFDPELAESPALSVRPAPTDPVAAREFSNRCSRRSAGTST